ncbi:FAD binding domain-containing protein [Halobellus limi]|uniref:Carbon-monoxide dehydrogenase medium subunit n=1 Tax=Halobellus limi TaxID=699433 RepID=A0A1H5ZML1_9EURY|nr:xanthine dehydrogenase family protein subunit M [Halobellus limi]QCC48035.1 xanthine dehydrogenase family protein subunit M [Halobellus limi]SEG37370.1 carbon-monoxide dehydrogenase medium subunit [Halobellus limi]
MKAAPFEHHEPTSVSQAVSLIESLDEPTILAGGQSLVPMLRFRLARPDTVVDINGIDELDYLREEDGYLKMGALARHADVEDDELIEEKYGSFADAAPLVADPQIRNRGTIVGSIAQADPKGDWGSILIAHDGEVVAAGPDGERTIPIDELFLLPYDTSLGEDELITEARVPTPEEREGSAYHKLKRKTGDYAMAGVAARLILDEDGRIETAGIGMTAVDITNARAADAEERLEGERPGADLFKSAGELAAEQSNPESDEHGDASYKERMVEVLTQRALGDAAERAGVTKRRATP